MFVRFVNKNNGLENANNFVQNTYKVKVEKDTA